MLSMAVHAVNRCIIFVTKYTFAIDILPMKFQNVLYNTYNMDIKVFCTVAVKYFREKVWRADELSFLFFYSVSFVFFLLNKPP